MAVFDLSTWTRLPWEFWAVLFFIFGTMVGSFLNVCIYRLPRDLSVVSPPSHCPKCQYRIPFYLNMPIITWTVLRGKCANCGARISPQYIIVELLTGLIFLGTWQYFGDLDQLGQSLLATLVFCLILSGFLVATWVDFEHYIIPDSITLGGIVVGFFLSFGVPQTHFVEDRLEGLVDSGMGIVLGWGLLYTVLRLGKLAFGQKRIRLPKGSRLKFSETGISQMGTDQPETPYHDLFFRNSDRLRMRARTVELPDRCYFETDVVLQPTRLTIGQEEMDPATISSMEVETEEIIQPQEAMGFGDVKFMGAIGAFLGWKAVLFSITVSSVLGSIVGLGLIAIRRREWSSRIPFGPYIAAAAAIYIFGGRIWAENWFRTGQLLP
ncbi:MAG: prepilin peptidase [Verrucomicrobia bacterium]|nr:prepilin peptidase [Verrucomicrobiota bacterium]